MTEEQNQQTEQKPVYRMGTGIPDPDEYQKAMTEPPIDTQNQAAGDGSTENNTANDESQNSGSNQGSEAQNQEDNAAAFVMPNFDGTQSQATAENNEGAAETNNATAQIIDWKEELKKADKKEILKELGYDDFLAEFAEFRKNGGDAYKYLEARAFDWAQVSAQDLILDDLKLQYPHLTEDKIEKLYQAKYKQSDMVSDDEKEIGSIQMEADAENIRQKRINEQKAFQIPAVQESQEVINVRAMLEEQQKLEAEQTQRVLQFFREHDATKSLYESKRVAIDLGDNGKFNFNIDKPENLMSVALDSEKWQRAVAVNPQEADASKLIPDVAKLQRLALVALNPNYEKDLVNYGKSLGLKAIVEEGQNARRPIGNTPTQPNESMREAFASRAKVSTLGR